MDRKSNLVEKEFVFVVKTDDLKLNVPSTFEVEDRFVVIVKSEDGIYCIDDVCTHDGGTLGDGEFLENCLVCPRHGAKFDVKTGIALTMPATESTASHEIKIDGDSVLVRLAI